MKYNKETLEIPKLVDSSKFRRIKRNMIEQGSQVHGGGPYSISQKKNSLKINLIIFFLFVIFFIFFLLNCKHGIFNSDLDTPVPYYNYYSFLKGTE